ncbi:MAG: ABC transporter substrate-binding protein [Alphaproteobacteria bacterium]|nr:ABC transporter substrate-binding protein [Alphaproteobacteria bacterium]
MNWLAVSGTIAVLAISPVSAFAQAHLAGAERFIKGMADRTISSLSQSGISESERRARFKALLNDTFAVRGISSYVLGRSWRAATPAQQEEFVTLFQDVTVNTWASRFSEFSNMQFVVMGATPAPSSMPGENAATVRTELRSNDGAAYKLEWRVANKDTLYKVTDIMVEGISMANTYRDEYAAVVARKGGIEGLLARMRDKRDSAVAVARP